MVDNKKVIGVLILIILSTAVYISLGDTVRIRVDSERTTFYIKELNDQGEPYGRWLVSGREYNRLFDGTKILNRDRKGITVNTTVQDNLITIIRTTPYKKGPIIKDKYVFNGAIDDVRLFPISHTIEIFNGSDYYYRYTVDDLKDTGDKRKLNGTYYDFGMRMSLELEPDYRWAWIGYPYGSDSLSAQYNIPSDHEVFNVRLFDPITSYNPFYYEFLSDDPGPPADPLVYLPFNDIGVVNYTMVGVTDAVGKIESALSFDGVDNYVNIDYPLGMKTWSLWLYGNAYEDARFLNADDGGANRNFYGVTRDPEQDYRFCFKSTSNVWACLNTEQPFIKDQWNHIVIVKGADNMYFYLNGNTTPETWGGSFTLNEDTGAPLQLGDRNTGSPTSPFNGNIDDFRIYNASFNITQILEIYNSGSGTEAETIDHSNLIFHADMNTLQDETNNINSSVEYRAEKVEGKFGTTALSFDGTEDYILTNKNITQLGSTTNADFSISAWFKTTTPGASYRSVTMIIGKGGIYVKDGELCTYNWKDAVVICSGEMVNDSVWHHAVMSLKNDVTDGSRMYLDGINILNFSYNFTTYPAMDKLLVGGLTTTQKFNGIIDEVSVYDTALTPSEVFILYNNTQSTEIDSHSNVDLNIFSKNITLTSYQVPGWLLYENYTGPNSNYNDTRNPMLLAGVCDPVPVGATYATQCNYYNATASNGHANNHWGSSALVGSDEGGAQGPRNARSTTNSTLLPFDATNNTIYLLSVRMKAYATVDGSARTRLMFAGQDIVDETKAPGTYGTTTYDYKIEYYNDTRAIVYRRVPSESYSDAWTWNINLTYLSSVDKIVDLYAVASCGNNAGAIAFAEIGKIYTNNLEFDPNITGQVNSTTIDFNSSVRKWKRYAVNEITPTNTNIIYNYSFDNGSTWTDVSDATEQTTLTGTQYFKWILKLITTDGVSTPTFQNFTVQVTDFQPQVSNVAISRENCTTLVCNYSYYDQLGEAESTRYYRWFENGTVMAGKTSATLDYPDFSQYSLYNCSVIVNDGEFNSTEGFSSALNVTYLPAIVSNVTISPNPAFIDDYLTCTYDCVGDCNSEKLNWYINSVLYTNTSRVCFQENANEIDGSDTADCGLNYDGTYTEDADFIYNGVALRDKNYGTWTELDGNVAAEIIGNWTKPDLENTDSMIFRIKLRQSSVDVYKNYTIPSSCFNYYTDKVRIKVYAVWFLDVFELRCYSGSWELVTQEGNTDRFYEDGVYWNIGTTLPSSQTSYGDNITCEVIVNNTQLNCSTCQNDSLIVRDSINATLNGLYTNVTYEMFTEANLSVDALGETVCIDIDQIANVPNTSCGVNSTTFEFWIDGLYYKNVSNSTDNARAVNLSFSGNEEKVFSIVGLDNRSEFNVSSFRLYGSGSPTDIYVDLHNDGTQDYFFEGVLNGYIFSNDEFSDNATSFQADYPLGGSNIEEVEIWGSSSIYNFTIKLNGSLYGIDITDEFTTEDYVDTSATTAYVNTTNETVRSSYQSVGTQCLPTGFEEGTTDPAWTRSPTSIYYWIVDNVNPIHGSYSFHSLSTRSDAYMNNYAYQQVDLTYVFNMTFDWKAQMAEYLSGGGIGVYLRLYIDADKVYEDLILTPGSSSGSFTYSGNDEYVNLSAYTGIHTLKWQTYGDPFNQLYSPVRNVWIDDIKLNNQVYDAESWLQSKDLFNPQFTNVTQIYLNSTYTCPAGNDLVWYFSNDGISWENYTTLAALHTFDSNGSSLYYKVKLNVSNDNDTCYIDSVRVWTPQSNAPQNVKIDVGLDGTYDWELGYELNTSNSPVTASTTTGFDQYINKYCNQAEFCSIPIDFVSTSAGTIIGYDLNISYDDVYVYDNVSYLQEEIPSHDYDLTHSINSTGGTIEIRDISYKYLGSGIIPILFHTADYAYNVSRSLIVRYSPFEWHYPNNLDQYLISPSSWTEYNVQPYGQDFKRNPTNWSDIWINISTGIFNVNFSNVIKPMYDHNATMYVYLEDNTTIPTCLNISVTNSSTRNILNGVNTSRQLLEMNITPEETLKYFSFVDLIACNETSGLELVDFNWTFSSYCDNCLVVDKREE